MKQRRFFLVYQAGIANVFEIECFNLNPYGRDAVRICQGSFAECEAFARGLAYGKHLVYSAACNKAGDITDEVWTEDLESAPFRESFNPVIQRNVIISAQ